MACAGGLACAISAFASGAGELDLPGPQGGAPTSQELRAVGMTYVGNRGEGSELVLNSRFATLYTDRDLADLVDVRAVFTDDADGESFEMTCDRAALNVETNDFRAEGDVHGTTSEGQRYTAPWVEYDHASGLLSSDAPVVMVDGAETYRGVGFEYQVEDRTFKLLRNVSVVHTP